MADKHAQLKQAIVDVFERMNRRYGYRRVHAQLRREGSVSYTHLRAHET